jgi:hypothetical protein
MVNGGWSKECGFAWSRAQQRTKKKKSQLAWLSHDQRYRGNKMKSASTR